MDIFTLQPDTYTQGEIINNLESVQWVERYQGGGEFSISTLRVREVMALLPVGTFISHTKTLTMMMVENLDIHEANYEEGSPVTLEITGRSVDQIAMENRITTENLYFGYGINPFNASILSGFNAGFSPFITQYRLESDYMVSHIIQMITDFLIDSINTSDENIPNLVARHEAMTYTDTAGILDFTGFNTVLKNVTDMLASIDAGIKVERPNVSHSTLDFVVHDGTDSSSEVSFYWSKGDLETARYFFSNRDNKNQAYVLSSQYGYRYHPSTHTGWDLREMLVNSDWSQTTPSDWTTMTLTQQSDAIAALRNAGKLEVSKHNGATIVEATASITAHNKFGTDYNIGDKVLVKGDYGVNAVMRVSEYAITQDAQGESGFPTLSQVLS